MKGGILVLGAGGHGRVVADTAEIAGYENVAFLDDEATTSHSGPYTIFGPLSALKDLRDDWKAAIPAVGNNRVRLDLLERLRALGYGTPAILHPAAVVSRHAEIGDGVFLAAGAIVNIGARLGDAVIVNTRATVDHDCEIGQGVHLSPGAHLAGEVAVGARSWVEPDVRRSSAALTLTRPGARRLRCGRAGG